MDLNEFQEILTNLQQNDDDIVQRSTEFYCTALQEYPSEIIVLHLQNILSFSSTNLVAMSIILLKRAFMNSEFEILSFIDEETINFISEVLPKLFENENLTPYLFSLLVDTSSFIATEIMRLSKMLDFIPKLVKMVKILSPTLSPPAIDCIVQCNNYNSLINFQSDTEYDLISLNDVYLIASTALTNDFSIDFTISSIRMLFSFYIDNAQTPQFIEFAQAISEIYPIIPENELSIALSDLYMFCKHSYLYFSETLPSLVTGLLAILENYNDNDENHMHIQTIVINIFILLAKSYDLKFKEYLSDVTAAVMIVSCNFQEDLVSDEVDLNAPFSDEAIFFLSEIFSSRTEYQSLVIKLSQEMIQREEWNCRRSALSAIYQLSLSCETGLDSYFDDILEMIKESFSDPNWTCRYYSFKSFSELCETYSLFVNQYIQSFVPLIISISKAEDNHQAKVAELESLESICSNISPESIISMSESVIEELLPEIESSDATPMEQLMIIKCISKIALSTQTKFDQFYSESMNWLKSAIEQIHPGEEDPILIQTIRTIPLVGKTVDLELFFDDAIEFLNLLLQSDFTIFGQNEKTSILFAIQEMSEILPQEAYNQFLPPIFNLLEQILSEEFETEEFPYSFDISSLSDRISIPMRNQNVIISYSRTQLDLNIECINVMIKLIENLKEVVIPFVRPISKIVSTFIQFAYYARLQSASLKLFDSLIILYRERDEYLLSQFLPFVRNTLFPVVSNLFANPVSILIEIFDILAHSMDDCQFNGSFTSYLITILQQLQIKRMDVYNKSQQPDEEQDFSVNENSPDLVALDDLEVSVERFAKTLLGLFTENMIQYSPILLHFECDIFHILYMTDLYIMMIECENNLIDIEQLLGIIFDSINSPRLSLNSTAFISLSKIIQIITPDPSLIQQSIDKIAETIQQYEEDENELPHKVIDGALIALAAIFKASYGKADFDDLISTWFKEMPVLLDDPDSNVAFEVLHTFFMDKNPQVFNPNSMTHLLRCCSVAIRMKKISDEIKEQIILLLKEVFSVEEMIDIIQEAIASLTVEDRKSIQNVI